MSKTKSVLQVVSVSQKPEFTVIRIKVVLVNILVQHIKL